MSTTPKAGDHPQADRSFSARVRWVSGKVLTPLLWLALGVVVDCTSRDIQAFRAKAAGQKNTVDLSVPDQATVYLKRKLPASPISALPADPGIPGLLPVKGGPVGADTWFDPSRRYLIVGLVVNLENPDQVIAPGKYAGGK